MGEKEADEGRVKCTNRTIEGNEMAQNRRTLSLLLPFPDARKLQLGATILVGGSYCRIRRIGERTDKNGFVRVAFAMPTAGKKE